MDTLLSKRASELSESGTIAMAQKSRELSESGINVINFTLGEPDFNTPDFIKDAAIEAIHNNFSHYSPVPGYNDLKEAIVHKIRRDNGGSYSPSNVVVSTGAKHSLMNIFISLLNPGDEVILFAPYWVSYKAMTEYNNAVSVIIDGKIENSFKVSAQELSETITEKTKIVLLNSPSNPSGTVYSRKELDEIVEVLLKNPHVFVISDEIYEHITYGEKTASLASYSELKDRMAIVNGLSKSFAMTGWRLGYTVAPEWLAKTMSKVQGQYTSGANAITQKAAVVALNESPERIGYMKEAFTERRKLASDLLATIPSIEYCLPDGAFYFFPKVDAFFGKSYRKYTISNSFDLAMFFLQEGHVSVVSGGAFGKKEHIRISFATSNENIKEGLSRIAHCLSLLK